jgi:hypothetical protein
MLRQASLPKELKDLPEIRKEDNHGKVESF